MDKLILQLGCGNSFYGTHRVDSVPTKATTHVHDLEDGIPFPDEHFDEIYEKNLLEHLRNVGFHLEECYRVLKKGGRLILITDNASCMRYYLFGTHEGRYEKKHRNNPNDKHYGIFTRSHLKNHLVHAGFVIENTDLIKTDTVCKIVDKITGSLPRIRAVARK